MTGAQYVVGIDLGTTHCVVAATPVHYTDVHVFGIRQLVAPGEVATRSLLPSFLYLPAPSELTPEQTALPWGSAPHVVGELALRLGAKTPGRMVASAKSWICHGGVNRRADILPWSAPDSEPHVSPYAASTAYLTHIRAAWDAEHPEAPLAQQDVVVTVPASFDDGARELTVEAARDAGLGTVRLLEEPQAAFYDFLGGGSDVSVLRDARLVLVVDVGGGTTDLTLLRVVTRDDDPGAPPELERIAVGGHLMLGGDNMDAALAHHVLEQANITRRLDPTEWAALVQSARSAKERLLAADAPEEFPVSVQQRGSRLIGGTRTVTLQRDAVAQVLLDGFVPMTGPDEAAARRNRAGLTTLGLPYATDPAVPRHVCAFLRRHADAAREAGVPVDNGLPRPDLLLLNGGVWNASAMASRMVCAVQGWFDGKAPARLAHTSLDTAVACGAARYGLARRGVGQVIGGGTARAYYLGVDGPEGTRQALCAAPRGLDDGITVQVPNRVFELTLDRPVVFPLYCYTGDRVDPPGAVVSIGDELDPLPPLETVLRDRSGSLRRTGERGVPVTLSAALNESGTLEISLVTVELPPRRFTLELGLGVGTDTETDSETETETETVGEVGAGSSEAGDGSVASPGTKRAQQILARVFVRAQGEKAKDAAKGLRRELEDVLGPRGGWDADTCRALWQGCVQHTSKRAATPVHELNWLRLCGWCLRPGYGAAGDPQRIEQMWRVHDQGLRHNTKANGGEWWIMWRRIAGGLNREQQATLFTEIRPWLAPGEKPPPGPRAHAPVEMMQLLAALERLEARHKQQVGEWFLQGSAKVRSWWPLGRLGARDLVRGDPADVVPPAAAEAWLQQVLALDWAKAEGAAFAAALIARVTDDSARDIDPRLRAEVLQRLEAAKAPNIWTDMVTRCTTLSDVATNRVLGDALPTGLRLA